MVKAHHITLLLNRLGSVEAEPESRLVTPNGASEKPGQAVVDLIDTTPVRIR
jgi:hypothetical protein